MKRRDALKNIGMATGFFVATPSILSLLQSCTSEIKTWTPEFLSVEQGVFIKNLVDIILPKTDLPAATELNVPEFIDKYLNEVLDEEDQTIVTNGFNTILPLLKATPETDLNALKPEDYKALLDNHMLVKDEIDPDREANPESLEMTKSEFLNMIKNLTITAYLTTEKIGETVLVYDPVPAAYYCGDLQELTGGKSYSL